MNLFLCGQKEFGAHALRALEGDGHRILGSACPVGEGTDALYIETMKRDAVVVPGGTLRAETLPAGTDLIVAAFCQDFIGERTRNRARIGAVGYHPSLLPRHRGRDAVEWTIRMGDPVAGGSVYWLANRCDGGDIAAQDWCFVLPDDDAKTLYRRELFPMGIRLLRAVVADIEAGKIIRRPQREAAATWEPSIGRPPVFRPELIQLAPSSRPR